MSHARTDIRVNTDCPDSWKVIRLCTRLGDGAFRCLIRLWCRVAQCRPDGELASLDERDIESLAGWTGDPGAFLAATLDAGLIDRSGDRSGDRIGYRIHGWTEHQPFISNRPGRQRASALANAAKRRKGRRKSFSAKDFSESVTGSDTDSDTDPVTDSVSPSSSPNGRKRGAEAAAGSFGPPPRPAPAEALLPMLAPPRPIPNARVTERLP